MESARMTFKEEALKLRIECRKLRIENAQLKRTNNILTVKVERLKSENWQLNQKVKLLEQKEQFHLAQLEQQKKQIESLNLIVEELRVMIFGKKKKTEDRDKTGSDEDNTNTQDGQTRKRKQADRSNMSYRRAVPEESDVTGTSLHLLTHCPDCGTLLLYLKQITRYTEDIVNLTEITKLLKRIEKHIIGSGYCPACKRRKTAIDISPQVTVLGENVKQFVCYLSIIMRMSFEQIRCFLKDTAGLNISDGEITACLDEQAEKLTPEKEKKPSF